MGLRDKYAKKIEEQGFKPLDLTEENVQAIFDRCLAEESAAEEEIAPSIIFSRVFGFNPEDEVAILFDRAALKADRKKILYLYGQLKYAHTRDGLLKFRDARITYRDVSWTDDIGAVLELLNLGCNTETLCISSFLAKTSSAMLSSDIKPTLSPKDPAFPAWWEQHKAEWEA